MPFFADAIIFFGVLLGFFGLSLAFWRSDRVALENLLLAPSLFYGGYALLVWLVGSAWKLVPAFWITLPWPVLVGLLVFRRRTVAAALSQLLRGFRTLSRTDWLLLGYLAVVSGLTFLWTLAPPTGNDYDSLTYHLAAPAQYLRHGKIIELQYDHHSYFPFTLEMWFMLGLAAKGAVLAKLFHWVMLPVGALTLVALACKDAGKTAGLWAAALYISMPLIPLEATTAYIDLGFTAFTLLAVLCLVRAGQTPNPVPYLACSGAFCGFSLGTKYFGALVFGFLGLWLLGEQLVAKKVSIKQLAVFAVPALVLGMPWYLRNWAWTGNPVYPFAFEVFGGKNWTLEMAQKYTEDQAKYGFGKGFVDLVWLPWRLAMTPLNFQTPFWPFSPGMTPEGSSTYGYFEVKPLVLASFVGPAWLAFGVPAFFIRSKPRPVIVALSFFTFLWLFWAITSQQIRYLVPGLAVLCLAGGWAIVKIRDSDQTLGRIPQVVAGIWLLFSLLIVWKQGELARVVVVNGVSAERFLFRTMPGYLAMQWVNTQTNPKAVIAVYGEPRCFYLNRDYFWADPDHGTWIPYNKIETGAQLTGELKTRGATHVLWATKGGFGPPPQWQAAVDEGLAVEMMVDRDGYKVFELR